MSESRLLLPGFKPATHTDSILINSRSIHRWYPGSVVAVHESSVDILYDDGDRERGVDTSFIRLPAASPSLPAQSESSLGTPPAQLPSSSSSSASSSFAPTPSSFLVPLRRRSFASFRAASPSPRIGAGSGGLLASCPLMLDVEVLEVVTDHDADGSRSSSSGGRGGGGGGGGSGGGGDWGGDRCGRRRRRKQWDHCGGPRERRPGPEAPCEAFSAKGSAFTIPASSRRRKRNCPPPRPHPSKIRCVSSSAIAWTRATAPHSAQIEAATLVGRQG